MFAESLKAPTGNFDIISTYHLLLDQPDPQHKESLSM